MYNSRCLVRFPHIKYKHTGVIIHVNKTIPVSGILQNSITGEYRKTFHERTITGANAKVKQGALCMVK